MARYIRRVVDDQLDLLQPHLAALSLEGAKGVGKTETAGQRAASVVRLDVASEQELLEADPNRLATLPPPVLVDEWQRYPPAWDLVRRAVDDGAAAGRYLLTGSAAPVEAPTHTGAGRIVQLRMRPMSLAERGIERPTVSLVGLLSGQQVPVDGHTALAVRDYTREIVASGFPGFRGLPPVAVRAHLDGYLARIVERGFVEQGHLVRKPATLRAWMAAYAAATATTASYTAILDAATAGQSDKPARSTVIGYRDVLEELWLLDPVDGWIPVLNPLGRLAQAPKHHLVDPALAARLVHMDEEGLLQGVAVRGAGAGSFLGHLFESLVTQSVRVYAQAAEARVAHFRTSDGRREVDLIVEGPGRKVVALEVKLSPVVTDATVEHLLWLRNRLGDDLLDAGVITTGPDAYRRRDGIAVIPAGLLGP